MPAHHPTAQHGRPAETVSAVWSAEARSPAPRAPATHPWCRVRRRCSSLPANSTSPPDTPPHQPPCRGPARRDQPAVGRRVDVTADTSRDRRCRRARLPRRLAGRRARRAVRPKPSACRASRLAATPRPRRRLARPAASASPERSPATAGGTGTDVRGDRPGRSPRSPSSSTTPPRPAAVAAVPWQPRRPPPRERCCEERGMLSYFGVAATSCIHIALDTKRNATRTRTVRRRAVRRPASPSGARASGPRTWPGRGPRGCAPRSDRARPRRTARRAWP